MGLAMKDMVKGTIVDWTYQWIEDDRTYELRNPRKRGIIRKTVGNGQDSVSEVWVQFKENQPAIKVQPRELVRVFPYNSKAARRALARLEGRSESIGGEFEERRAPIRPRAEDGLALTPGRSSPIVEPENDEVDPMIASQHQTEPLVKIDNDEENAEK